MDWESKATKMGLNIDQIRRDLVLSYLKSSGGVREFSPGSIKAQNVMKSLDLWIVGECKSVQKSSHKASSCRVVVGVLTEKGVEEAQKLFNQSNDAELKNRLKNQLHDFPPRVMKFLVAVLSEYKVLNEFIFSRVESAYFDCPYLPPAERKFLPEQFAQEMANILSQLGLGVINCPTHNVKGWASNDLLRIPPETVALLESIMPCKPDLPSMMQLLKEYIGNDIATLELIQVISKGELTFSDLKAMEVWPGKKTYLFTQLEDFNRKGLTTKPPTKEVSTVLLEDLKDTRSRVLERIKTKATRWWKAKDRKVAIKEDRTERPKKPATEAITIGSKKETAQWGIVGRSRNRLVKFDLNFPHIVFICGKMGSGKGYTIGVLCEMLASQAIPGLSNVSKKATIIVFYNPREDKRSEFWSIRTPNDVDKEIQRLREEYNVEPQSLVLGKDFRIFVDPAIYTKAVEKFKTDYGTSNVYPLHVDPSTLTGKEWAIVLSAGGTTDQLYVKRLFSIIEDLQFKPFHLDTIRTQVLSDSTLTQGQKKLADLRLMLLKNYLAGVKDQEFISNLALGGVNIFDFRKTIRTPDDLFSIMTLILSVLQTKKDLENEPFVFVINEAHDYFKGGMSKEFVESIDYLIRRKRHGANWLLLDTHFPDDVDDKVIKLADVKIVHFLDKAVESKILKRVFERARYRQVFRTRNRPSNHLSGSIIRGQVQTIFG